MEPTTIFSCALAFSWIVFLWDTYLSYRQYRKYVTTIERPPEVHEIMDSEEFAKSRSYKIDKAQFGFAHSIFSQLENTAILCYQVMPLIWYWSNDVVNSYGYEHEIIVSIVFMLAFSIIQDIMSIPWSLYDTFIIEERHGFNKQTLGFFIKDHIKKLLVSSAITIPVVAALIWIIRAGGDYFFFYVWLFLSLFTLLMMTVYPEFIAPLFDKYTPLPDGELREKIEALAARLDYPLKKLFVVENSKRSAHSNAYLYGFWNNKRIVLYDTLLEDYSPVNAEETKEDETDKQTDDDNRAEDADSSSPPKRKKLGMNNDEVVAVLGHELGHWKLNHVLKNLVISEANLFLLIYGFQYLYGWTALYHAFGFTDQPVLVGLVLIFSYVFGPYNEILGFLMTLFTRHNEFGADHFSAELGYGELLVSALIKLSKDNLTFPVNDWLYSCVNHSHPPVVERVRAVRLIKPKDE